MAPLRRQKQERFCLEYFKSGNAAAAATLAGYSVRSIRSIASELLTNPNIQARLRELRDKAEAESIMTVLERKQRLTEIARARVSDFVAHENGKTRVKVDLDSANNAAILEVNSEEILNGAGTLTKLKLRDPVAAINELNKMEGSYAPDKLDINVTIIPVINTVIVQVVQLFIQINEIDDPTKRKEIFGAEVKKLLEKNFPDLPKEQNGN